MASAGVVLAGRFGGNNLTPSLYRHIRHTRHAAHTAKKPQDTGLTTDLPEPWVSFGYNNLVRLQQQ